ncbi:MAG: hypothetical protein EOO73_13090 [Myxococcales bacterium]|nr:MAG: hypothetical protein EOO73_13090 [Myxococcales bacterium]
MISPSDRSRLTGPVPEAGSRESHFPLADGARFSYRHTSLVDEPWDETDSIAAVRYREDDAFLLSDREDAAGERTHSTLIARGSGVWRAYKEVTVADVVSVTTAYDPPFLRYDEAWRTVGDTVTLDDDWQQTCVVASSASNCAPGAVKSGRTTHRYTVLAVAEKLSVPAGDFEAVKVQRDNLTDPETKWFWFASGVGKIREENPTTGAVTELTEYQLP